MTTLDTATAIPSTASVTARSAKEPMPQSLALALAILDSVVPEIAVLDGDGVIIAVNASWRRFAAENRASAPGSPRSTDIGSNYLEVCRTRLDCADDDGQAERIGTGIRSVLDGSSPRYSCEYPCHAPQQQRWFSMVVTPLKADGLGVVITHTDITDRVFAERAVQQAKDALAFKEEQLSQAMRGSGVGMWDHSIATGNVDFSDTWMWTFALFDHL